MEAGRVVGWGGGRVGFWGGGGEEGGGGGGVSPTPWPSLSLGKTRYPLYRRLVGPLGWSE